MGRKVGKNKRKGWRTVDISEFEEFLEDQRLQERTGGLVAEKSNEDLFVIDKDPQKVPAADALSRRQRKQAKVKELRSFASLKPDTRVPPVITTVRGGTSKRRVKVCDTTKLAARLERKKLQRAVNKQKVEAERNEDPYDLWAEDPNAVELEPHYAKETKRRRVNVPIKFFLKPSALSAVESPHPGTSYNPAYDDHQELLQEAVKVCVKDDLAEKKLKAKLKPNLNSIGGRPVTKETTMKEMSAGLGMSDDDDSEDEGEATQEGNEEEKKKKTIKIKTRAQRNKQKRHMLEERMRKLGKEEMKRERRNQIDQIKVIQKQIVRREKMLAEKAAKKEAKNASLPFATKRLHKDKYKPLEIDVALTEELSGSLRTSKNSGNLLAERYNSFLKRNMIAPRATFIHTKRRPLRHTEKRAFREITQSSRAGGGIVIPQVSN